MTEAMQAVESEPTVALKVQLVKIQRDLAHIVTEAFEHEIPILDRIHGQPMVKVIDEDYHELEIPADAETELLRLKGKYDRKNALYVEAVYPNAAALAAAVKGFKAERGKVREKVASQAIERKPPRPSSKKAAAK